MCTSDVISQQLNHVVHAVAIRVGALGDGSAFVPYKKNQGRAKTDDYRVLHGVSVKLLKTYGGVSKWYNRQKRIPLPVVLQHRDNMYELEKQIGSGSFSKVYVASMNVNKKVAVKVTHNSFSYFDGTKLESTVSCMFKKMGSQVLNDNCIVEPLDQFTHVFRRIFVFPLFLGNLHQYRSQVKDSIDIVGMQLLTAVAFIHKHNIIHCDIKPENILVQETGIKLADFGSCSLGTLAGPTYAFSRYYRPPEVVFGQNVSTAGDVWSVACVMYEIIVGYPLFPGYSNSELIALMCDELGFPDNCDESQTRQLFSNDGSRLCYRRRRPHRRTTTHALHRDEAGKRGELDKIDEKLQPLLRKMLVWEPEARITAQEALHMLNTIYF